MKISQVFQSKWLKAADLQGAEVKVQISGCAIEEFTDGDKKDTKPVLYFTGKKKGLMLNRTNSAIIADTYGDDTDGWIGQDIIIYPDKTLFQGKMVECLRVRTPIPTANGESIDPGF